MNAVEIEQAVSKLAEEPFDAGEFPFAFLEAFGKKGATLKRLRAGATNRSDVPGGVLKRDDIHIATCAPGKVSETLASLRASPRTASEKARYILATDGVSLEAEDLTSDEAPVVCAYADLPNHFGFFLPLAGITTVKQIRESAFDIRATSRLNRLYVELLKDNPDWAAAERRPDMNHFMARLIFCFFAEDTDIFGGQRKFTGTVETMSARDSSNTHEVLAEIFRAMNIRRENRAKERVARWADDFPYVNGGLFSGSPETPRFSRIARSYFLHIGNLDWTKINPDIFGSMIQAVADDEERGALGMHYTSVPNILKVLNPLFLDDLREKLDEAGDNPRTLLNLRKRISRIRVFDPACGSGNFLVIAYKEMRAIEAEINRRRGEAGRRSDIPLTNFRGIELRDFPAEIARLALIIAEYQCDVLYRGQQEALADFLPLDAENWIRCDNALRLDWREVCPPAGAPVKFHADDLFLTPSQQPQIDFENEGGETYICGNPPYVGSKKQTLAQRADISRIFAGRTSKFKTLDYVCGWFLKSADYIAAEGGRAAFVSTNSVCQGEQVADLWPSIFAAGARIEFAHLSFKWQNLAAHNAGVTVVIVGVGRRSNSECCIYDGDSVRRVPAISPYLFAGDETVVRKRSLPLSNLSPMRFGNHPYYATDLMLTPQEARELQAVEPRATAFLRPLYGSQEFVDSAPRICIWAEEDEADAAQALPALEKIFQRVREKRKSVVGDPAAQALADTPYKFRDQVTATNSSMIVPRVSSERRGYLPAGLLYARAIVQDRAFISCDAPLWELALVVSRLHLVWIGTVCVRMRTDFSYSNTLGWNTFPVPPLTEKNKADLTRCAEDILLAREAHWPATIAELYDPENMPADLRAAHERNDEVLERIYIGRRFRNDTERLEKLFELYGKMVARPARAS